MRDLLALFAEPNRRRIIELLASQEQSVNSLAGHFDVTRSAVSQHLSALVDAGLVEGRQDGRFRFYRLLPSGVADLRASIDEFWTAELDELAAGRHQPKGDLHVIVDKSVIVPLGPEETFAMLTEPARLRRWQAVTARIELRAGGDYRWTIDPAHTAAGKVVEFDPGKKMVISFGWEGSDDVPPGTSTVTITLEPTEGGTLVRLVHEGLSEEQSIGHGEGWGHFLDRLVVAARDGDAGVDEWWARADELDGLTAAETSLAYCQLVLRRLSDADMTKQTACAKFDVSGVIEHLAGSVMGLGNMAGAGIDAAEIGPGSSPETRIAEPAQKALEAWRKRGTDGMVDHGDSKLPAPVAVNILCIEFLLHAWDIATATSQTFSPPDALSQYVMAAATGIVRPEMRDGDRFGLEVEVGPDASILERLVAFTGRTAQLT